MSEGEPARVTRVELEIVPPSGLPAGLRAALMRVAERCTVHNSLRHPPEVTFALAPARSAA
jgi:hypothetical protein